VVGARRDSIDRLRSDICEGRSNCPHHMALDHILARRAPWLMPGLLFTGAFRSDEELHTRVSWPSSFSQHDAAPGAGPARRGPHSPGGEAARGKGGLTAAFGGTRAWLHPPRPPSVTTASTAQHNAPGQARWTPLRCRSAAPPDPGVGHKRRGASSR
jgi:hypothetical protein